MQLIFCGLDKKKIFSLNKQFSVPILIDCKSLFIFSNWDFLKPIFGRYKLFNIYGKKNCRVEIDAYCFEP